MGSHVSIDHPDTVIHWFAGYPQEQRRLIAAGPCPHICEHRGTSVVAWGSDLEHYELIVCDDACAGRCRAWVPVDDNAHGGTHGPKFRRAMAHPDMRLLQEAPIR